MRNDMTEDTACLRVFAHALCRLALPSRHLLGDSTALIEEIRAGRVEMMELITKAGSAGAAGSTLQPLAKVRNTTFHGYNTASIPPRSLSCLVEETEGSLYLLLLLLFLILILLFFLSLCMMYHRR